MTRHLHSTFEPTAPPFDPSAIKAFDGQTVIGHGIFIFLSLPVTSLQSSGPAESSSRRFRLWPGYSRGTPAPLVLEIATVYVGTVRQSDVRAD
jgi:hypothetical protein